MHGRRIAAAAATASLLLVPRLLGPGVPAGDVRTENIRPQVSVTGVKTTGGSGPLTLGATSFTAWRVVNDGPAAEHVALQLRTDHGPSSLAPYLTGELRVVPGACGRAGFAAGRLVAGPGPLTTLPETALLAVARGAGLTACLLLRLPASAPVSALGLVTMASLSATAVTDLPPR